MAGLLLVVAHPDDEIFCSGLLCHLARNGISVTIACLTRGEGGQLGHPPIATRENIGKIREAEMLKAAAVLGAADVIFLDHVDPEPDGRMLKAPKHDFAVLVSRIADLIAKVVPQIILTHGSTGDYGHPAHVLVHNATRKAASQTSSTLYSFNAFFPGSGRMGALNRKDWADLLFDGSRYNDQRMQSFWEHRTQWPVFVGTHESEERYRSALQDYFSSTELESYCLQATSKPSDPGTMANWMGDLGSKPPRTGAVTRIKYKTLWSLRDIARAIKRLLA